MGQGVGHLLDVDEGWILHMELVFSRVVKSNAQLKVSRFVR